MEEDSKEKRNISHMQKKRLKWWRDLEGRMMEGERRERQIDTQTETLMHTDTHTRKYKNTHTHTDAHKHTGTHSLTLIHIHT